MTGSCSIRERTAGRYHPCVQSPYALFRVFVPSGESATVPERLTPD